jgi:hypothetical protein
MEASYFPDKVGLGTENFFHPFLQTPIEAILDSREARQEQAGRLRGAAASGIPVIRSLLFI